MTPLLPAEALFSNELTENRYFLKHYRFLAVELLDHPRGIFREIFCDVVQLNHQTVFMLPVPCTFAVIDGEVQAEAAERPLNLISILIFGQNAIHGLPRLGACEWGP